MANMSDYLENQLASSFFASGSFSFPASLYIGLFTATPTDASGTEVSGGSYARANGAKGSWTVATAGDGSTQATNNNAITFPNAPTANWGTITHFGIYDALTSGNLLFWGELSASRTVNSGDGAPQFSAGALAIKFF